MNDQRCYCINPLCERRQNPDNVEQCLCCGTPLLINQRIRLLKPLRELSDDPFIHTEIFEVDDAGTRWRRVRERRVMKILKWNCSKLLELFEREATTLQQIQHPSVPKSTIDDFFTVIPNNSALILHCLVMQKFDGPNLNEWVESHGKISQSLALEWLKQLVSILHVVHRSNFFHRDIKPNNVIVQPDGQLALIDFGVARQVTDTYLAKLSGSGGTSTGKGGKYEITSVSTPRYTPLEQINGQAVPQSDFYALGRTFVLLCTGIQLMDLPTDQKTGRLIWRKKAPQIEQPLVDFLEELMAPFPAQRPKSTEAILHRLEGLPRRTKIHRVVRSTPFKISATILIVLSGAGFYQLITHIIAEYFFNQATRHQDYSPTRAKQYYELAIKFNPHDIYAYNNLAVLCQRIRDDKCVVNNYQSLFKLQPNNWQGHYGLGSFYDQRKQYNLAQQQYQLAIQNNPQAVPAINNLSRLHNIKGDTNTAINLALQGLELTQEPRIRAPLLKNLAWAQYEQGKSGKLNFELIKTAQANLQLSIKLDSARTDSWCLLAQTQEVLGQINASKLSQSVCLNTNSNLERPEIIKWRHNILQRLFPKP